jgi:hypothetical protein
MPEFDILWAPLSRKWQVWQRQSDNSGCTIETLIGEFSSEGRAHHEVAILRGDLPADAAYEQPRRRRWLPIGGSRKSGRTVEADGVPGAPEPAPNRETPGQANEDPAARAGQPETPASSDAAEEWRQELIAQIDRARMHAERAEIESVRKFLELALLAVPSADQKERAA